MSRSPESVSKNERFAKALSHALSSAPLAVPLAAGIVVIDAAINTPPAIAQVANQEVANCVVVKPENTPAVKSAPGKVLLECETVTLEQKRKAFYEQVGGFVIHFGAGVAVVLGGAFVLAVIGEFGRRLKE